MSLVSTCISHVLMALSWHVSKTSECRLKAKWGSYTEEYLSIIHVLKQQE